MSQAMNAFDPPEAVRPLDRRRWLQLAGLSGLAALLPTGCQRPVPGPSAETGLAEELIRFPGKVPMRAINSRPPCLETPWRYFREDLTPNDAFYVRWHLQLVPTAVDLRTYRLRVSGEVERPLELSLDDLRRRESVSIVAVNQCSGNSRSLSTPQVPGAQWQNGAMGNARWTGVPLHALLREAGVKDGAVDVRFQGLDRAGIPSVPDFLKSLSIDMARRPEVLLAYEMNGQPLPALNGFPLRLVVPGWFATYWVKALSDIAVLTKPYDGYWMSKAYRLPATPDAVEDPQHLAEKTVPIQRMYVRSFFTTPDAGASVRAGQPCALDGIAFDGGDGIQKVEVSVDSGSTWQAAELGPDLGRFSFRRWRMTWQPAGTGRHILSVRATSNSGQTQPVTARWNRGGFQRNGIETLEVSAAG
ncbi:MAG: molybdopterin-dependent oxidoreductase [Gemmataceae bacterium]|nr:molybdopterin-dependent oxidoreductase [Gemmataceae bacterium]